MQQIGIGALGRHARRALRAMCFGMLAACGGPDLDVSGGDGTTEVREIRLFEPPGQTSSEALPLGPPKPTIMDALRQLDDIAKRPYAKGVLLRVGRFDGAFGRAQDLARGLARVRAAKKPVHCHFDAVDNVGYALLASSCDRISMTPAGDLDLVGPSIHLLFARQLFENVGITPELYQVGKYKGAADPFMERGPSEALQRSMDLLVGDLSDQLVDAIAKGRKLPRETARALLDRGPFDATGAKEAGLIDHVAFDDEARAQAKAAAGVKRVRKIDLVPDAEAPSLGEILAALSGTRGERETHEKHVALVRVEGSIVDSEERDGSDVRSGAFVAELRKLARSAAVKAIVLRIDSPGGSALASDRIWHAVYEARAKKPVVVSVGDMAASGGYYIASASGEIFANESSLVGSIGVVGGKFSVGPLAERIGLDFAVLSRGDHAGWTSPTRPFDDDERAHLVQMLERTYDRFLRRIVLGRATDRERLTPAAEGRLMSGARAKELGLVDHVGGLGDAVARAKELAKLPTDAPVVAWPADRDLLDAIASAMGAPEESTALRAVERATGGWLAVSKFALFHALFVRGDRAAAALPYVIEVR